MKRAHANLRWAFALASSVYAMHLVFDEGYPAWYFAGPILSLLYWHLRATKEDLTP